MFCLNPTAEPIRGFIQRDLDILPLAQVICRSQACDSTSNDCDIVSVLGWRGGI